MQYETFLELMEDFFPNRAEEILDQEYRKFGIDDIETADENQKFQLVNEIISKYGKFSSQRNRLLYDSMLEVLSLKPKINIETAKVTDVGPTENIVLNELKQYGKKLNNFYEDYELVLNIYWQKGLEMIFKGEEEYEVLATVSRELRALRQQLFDHYTDMLESLHLSQINKLARMRRSEVFHLTGESMINFTPNLNNQQKQLLNILHEFWNKIQLTLSELRDLFLDAMDEDIKLKRRSYDDQELVSFTQDEIKMIWNKLINEYDNLQLKIASDPAIEEVNRQLASIEDRRAQ